MFKVKKPKTGKPRPRKLFPVVLLALFAGCAGWGRSCSSCTAQSFGADWVVVQVDMQGQPFRCWELRDTSIANEQGSDGIYWKENGTGNLVHISNFYNRVQVVNGNWDQAFRELGLTREGCKRIRDRNYDPPGPSNSIRLPSGGYLQR